MFISRKLAASLFGRRSSVSLSSSLNTACFRTISLSSSSSLWEERGGCFGVKSSSSSSSSGKMFTTTTAAAAAREAHRIHHRHHRFLGGRRQLLDAALKTQMQQKRSIFIQTQSTPNPSSLMFLPGKPVLEDSSSMNFSSARESMRSPLAKSLFTIDGVTGVFFGADFVTVTKSEAFDWEMLKPEVFAKIMDFYASGEAVVKEEGGEVEEADDPNRILDTDSETVAMIKELLETRIKPAVAEDGGDIAFKKFDEQDGLVYVELRGACDGCPSSTVTLKSGIENMLMHYVPEVKGVVPWEGDKEMDLLDMADLMRGR